MCDLYEVYEYAEAGRWKFFFSGKLWECRYQANRLEMPWQIRNAMTCQVKLRGDGQASVVEV